MLKNISNVGSDINTNIGKIWHSQDYNFDLEKDDFWIVNSLYSDTRDMAINLLDISNIAARLSDYVGKTTKFLFIRKNLNKIVIGLIIAIASYQLIEILSKPDKIINDSEKTIDEPSIKQSLKESKLGNQIDTKNQPTNKSPNNIFYLQSYHPIELFNGNLIFTLEDIIDHSNQEFQLKLFDKSANDSQIVQKRIGDLIYFQGYVITLLSLEQNLSIYDLKIRAELK